MAMDFCGARTREQGDLTRAALRRSRHVERGGKGKRRGSGPQAIRVFKRRVRAAQSCREGREVRAEERVDVGVSLTDPDPVQKDEEDARRFATPPDGGLR